MAHVGKWVVRTALVTVSGLALTACASSGPSAFDPKYDTRIPQTSRSQQARGPDRAPPSSATQAGSSSRRGGTWKPYQVAGKWYYPAEQPDYDETGIASWYGDAFNGKPTATGELFDMYGLTAAHKTLPLPSVVEVTNLDNGRSMQLRVNDRGPFVDGRIIDLSRGAADQLGVTRTGLAHVRVRYIGPAPKPGLPDSELRYAAAPPPKRPAPVAPPVLAAQPPLEAPPEPSAELAEAEQSHVAVALASEPVPETPHAPAPVLPITHFEIQAGAFSSRANAERAASQLAGAGRTEIREMERNGQTLYRVVVSQLSDEATASDALDKVATAGYHDAVLRRLN